MYKNDRVTRRLFKPKDILNSSNFCHFLNNTGTKIKEIPANIVVPKEE